MFARFGLADAEGLSPRDMAVVWNLRIPRALMGALVGAALALAGAGLQGLFGNPLADPGVVGVSQGAALGAVAAIVLGATALGEWTVPAAAFVGGLVSTTLIYLLARPGHGNGTITLLLADYLYHPEEFRALPPSAVLRSAQALIDLSVGMAVSRGALLQSGAPGFAARESARGSGHLDTRLAWRRPRRSRCRD